MLPKKLRLRHTQIGLIRKTGQKLRDKFLQAWVVVKKNQPKPFFQWSVFVPKHKIRLACDRHRVKRLVVAALVNLSKQTKPSQSIKGVIIITAHQPCLKEPDIEKELSVMLDKLRFL